MTLIHHSFLTVQRLSDSLHTQYRNTLCTLLPSATAGRFGVEKSNKFPPFSHFKIRGNYELIQENLSFLHMKKQGIKGLIFSSKVVNLSDRVETSIRYSLSPGYLGITPMSMHQDHLEGSMYTQMHILYTRFIPWRNFNIYEGTISNSINYFLGQKEQQQKMCLSSPFCSYKPKAVCQ